MKPSGDEMNNHFVNDAASISNAKDTAPSKTGNNIRRSKMKKVLAGGCFNRIHRGHVYFMSKAKSFGDYLVIVLANDKNNKKPYAVPATERKRNLEKLNIADKIIIGDPTNFLKVVNEERPDIIALGYDQKLPSKEIEKLGIEIKRIEKFGDYSSSKLKQCGN